MSFLSHFYDAAKSGNTQTLSRFMDMHTVEERSQALKMAALYNQSECVKLLIPFSDPLIGNSEALRWAANSGSTECVQLLIAVSDTNAGKETALELAARKGHTECVQLLIGVSDPKAHNSMALEYALEYGHFECADLLFEVSEPERVLTKMKLHRGKETWAYLEGKIQTQQAYAQRVVLEREIIATQSRTSIRKL